MYDRSPSTPFPDVEDAGKPVRLEGSDAIAAAAYRGAVTAADAYRSVRAAVRVDGEVLRIGNRFVSRRQYKEVAFLSVGNAAVSQALAVSHALGEAVTQGFVAGPDPLPEEVPFKSAIVPRGWPGSVAGTKAAHEALELAEGLGERDLFLVLLSPGALAALAIAPGGMDSGEWVRPLRETLHAGASSAEVALLARLTGAGCVAGRLAAAARAADTVTLVVERGEGGHLIGGGPTCYPSAAERQAGRGVLERTGQWSALSPALRRAVLEGEALRAETPGAARPNRPVVVAGPPDALRGAADAVEEKRWLPRLLALHLSGNPADAARRLLDRFDEVASAEGTIPSDRKGMVGFAATTLEVLEGDDERDAMRSFLTEATNGLRHRDASVALLRTCGAGKGDAPAGAIAGPGSPTGAARSLGMRSGVTDVGMLALLLRPK
ncbi:MAG: DUF4147 domain-containing protein [Thermoplasmata archaeon]|nr:DUF4147 domain-containing protein [Thermoplasmata archaeon]